MDSNKKRGFQFYSQTLGTKVIFFPEKQIETLDASAIEGGGEWLRLLENYEQLDIPYEMIRDDAVVASVRAEAVDELGKSGDRELQHDIAMLMNAAARQGSTVGAYAADMAGDDDDILFDIRKT